MRLAQKENGELATPVAAFADAMVFGLVCLISRNGMRETEDTVSERNKRREEKRGEEGNIISNRLGGLGHGWTHHDIFFFNHFEFFSSNKLHFLLCRVFTFHPPYLLS